MEGCGPSQPPAADIDTRPRLRRSVALQVLINKNLERFFFAVSPSRFLQVEPAVADHPLVEHVDIFSNHLLMPTGNRSSAHPIDSATSLKRPSLASVIGLNSSTLRAGIANPASIAQVAAPEL